MASIRIGGPYRLDLQVAVPTSLPRSGFGRTEARRARDAAGEPAAAPVEISAVEGGPKNHLAIL